MNSEEIKRNAEFLMDLLPGMEIPGTVKFRCKYKHMVEFTKCFRITNPLYVNTDEKKSHCVSCVCKCVFCQLYINMATISFKQNGKKRGFLLDFSKLLHAANEYDWTGCVKIRPGDLLTIQGKIGKIWVNEKMRLFGEIYQTARNQHGELVCKVKSVATIAPGGY